MKRLHALPVDRSGAAALEFALIAPIFLLVVVGIFQLGLAFHASAGLRNGVEAAARYAQIYPRPTDSQIQSMFTQNTYGLNNTRLTGPTLNYVTVDGVRYVDVSASYDYRLDFLFIPAGSVTLSHARRAYQY